MDARDRGLETYEQQVVDAGALLGRRLRITTIDRWMFVEPGYDDGEPPADVAEELCLRDARRRGRRMHASAYRAELRAAG
ncbi:hypothetical protein J0910_29875 [Nocardiopsis sp. CNT-189]|uniref:hypothetical protein n=1 Tax=Nocardiopsis oceanisediminis TaxID=2816862 RepID=UPI003B2CEDC5